MIVDHDQTKFNASGPTAGLKAINLALQGGGSHCAFMWGVLDRLLEDDRLSFDGITATSMEAVNAVVLADGLAAGGRDGAKNLLRTFWRIVQASSNFPCSKNNLASWIIVEVKISCWEGCTVPFEPDVGALCAGSGKILASCCSI